MNAELVTARHLGRKAVIYIRQSSPHQVLTNQESLRLQYALRQRACELGWQEAGIEVIDTDLGLSGATAEHRRGFKELIARVTWARSASSCPTRSPGSRGTARIGILARPVRLPAMSDRRSRWRVRSGIAQRATSAGAEGHRCPKSSCTCCAAASPPAC